MLFGSGVSGGFVVCDEIDRLLWLKKIMENLCRYAMDIIEEGFFEKKYICGV